VNPAQAERLGQRGMLDTFERPVAGRVVNRTKTTTVAPPAAKPPTKSTTKPLPQSNKNKKTEKVRSAFDERDFVSTNKRADGCCQGNFCCRCQK
jgi:hypothetical protein